MQDEIISIETPEHVTFEYEVAGIFSRILALGLDLLLQASIMIGTLLAAILAGVASFGAAAPWLVALYLVFAFLVMDGYFILFEIRWNGATPGKRAVGLRVVKEDGSALLPGDVVVRNVVRLVDMLPLTYFVGAVVMIANRRFRRLGDFAAGTVVVRDRKPAALRQFTPRAGPPGASQPAQDEETAQILRAGVHKLNPEEMELVENYLRRRSALAPEAARRLARDIARPLMDKLGLQSPYPERFLLKLRTAHRAASRPSGPAA